MSRAARRARLRYPPSMPARLLILVLASLAAGACSAPRGGRTVAFEPAELPLAFDAAREALIDIGFALDRVDSQAGVITTLPKQTAGLLTPWHAEQSRGSDEIGDLANPHRRIARIIFGPATAIPERIDSPADASPPAGAPAEFRELRVHVVVERRHTPGRRIEPDSIRRSSTFVDPALGPRRMIPVYWVAIDEDRALGERLAADIRRRMGRTKNGAPARAGAP